MCLPDDSFSDEGWKTLFEYDDSIRSFLRRQNRPPQRTGNNEEVGCPQLDQPLMEPLSHWQIPHS